MCSMGMVPDEITFVGILSACCYTWKVEDGRQIFDSTLSEWLIEPKDEYYAIWLICSVGQDMLMK